MTAAKPRMAEAAKKDRSTKFVGIRRGRLLECDAILYILYSTYAVRDDLRGSIAHEAHLGGAIAGIVLTLILRPDALGMFLSN
jgi:membrane associated rhomboid family serine protease